MSVAPRPRPWAAPIHLNPQNSLEAMLIKIQKGEMDDATFCRYLMTMSVYVATDDIDTADRERSVSPVILSWSNGNYLAVFSQMDRVGTLVGNKEGGSVQMLFHELLAQVPEGMGVVLNPNIGTAIDFPPEKVVQLLSDYRALYEADA